MSTADPFFEAVADGSTTEVAAKVDADENREIIIFWEDDQYSVFSRTDVDFCLLRAGNGYGDWTLMSSPSDEFFAFSFENNEATSLKEGQEVKLNIAFQKSGDFDFGWGERNFTVSKEDGVRFQGDPVSSEFLSDFAKNDRLIIYRETEDGAAIVFGLNLKGSARAISKLRECAFKQSGLNPNDPFLQ